MFYQDNRQNVHNLIDRIFKTLFPARGMAERPAQVQLSYQMLDSMLDGRIAICGERTSKRKTPERQRHCSL